jgi:hypothetical protein
MGFVRHGRFETTFTNVLNHTNFAPPATVVQSVDVWRVDDAADGEECRESHRTGGIAGGFPGSLSGALRCWNAFGERRLEVSGSDGVEVFKPEGQVDFSGGDVAGGNQAEDGILNLLREFGERVAGASADNGVEFVEAELIVDGERGQRSEGEGLAGAGGERGLEAGGDVLWIVLLEDTARDGLQGGELRRAQVLSDVHGAVVDKLLKAKARSGLNGWVRLDQVLIFSTDGHDTIS